MCSCAVLANRIGFVQMGERSSRALEERENVRHARAAHKRFAPFFLCAALQMKHSVCDTDREGGCATSLMTSLFEFFGENASFRPEKEASV